MKLLRIACVAMLAIWTAVAPQSSSAQLDQRAPVRLVPVMPNGGWQYAREIIFPVWYYYPDACDTPVYPGQDVGGTLLFRLNGQAIESRGYNVTYDTSCVDGVRSRKGWAALPPSELSFGSHPLTIEFSGNSYLQPSSVATVLIIRPDVEVARGSNRLAAGTAIRYFGGTSCTSESMSFSSTPLITPPAGLRFLHSFLNYRFESCWNDCGFGTCPSLVGVQARKSALIEYPAEIPPNASLWMLDASSAGAVPVWKPLAARIDGRFARVRLTGTPISIVFPGYPDDVSGTYWSLIQGSLGLAIPADAAPAGVANLQDMWWGGPGEDGWGASIAQAGDRLFVTLHAYDDSGQPAFFVLQDGTWDADQTSFGGSLYRPDARSMGQPVGSLHLLFADPDKPLLRYTLPSGEGLKPIRRMEFGPSTSQNDSQAGVWNLTLSGTGAMTIHKRGDALFMTWLEFPGNGPGQWMVAPAGKWTEADTYEAALYRTTASAWAKGYDASRFSATPAGSLKVRFAGPDDGEVTYTIEGVTRSSPLRRHGF